MILWASGYQIVLLSIYVNDGPKVVLNAARCGRTWLGHDGMKRKQRQHFVAGASPAGIPQSNEPDLTSSVKAACFSSVIKPRQSSSSRCPFSDKTRNQGFSSITPLVWQMAKAAGVLRQSAPPGNFGEIWCEVNKDV